MQGAGCRGHCLGIVPKASVGGAAASNQKITGMRHFGQPRSAVGKREFVGRTILSVQMWKGLRDGQDCPSYGVV